MENDITYWKDLVKDLCGRIDNNTINYFKLKTMTQELFLKYSSHQKNCPKLMNNNNICSCGYEKILIEFNQLK